MIRFHDGGIVKLIRQSLPTSGSQHFETFTNFSYWSVIFYFGCHDKPSVNKRIFLNVIWCDYIPWYVRLTVPHSDMFSHRVWWMQPSKKLPCDVFNLSGDHVIKGHVIGRLGTISSFRQDLVHREFSFLNLAMII